MSDISRLPPSNDRSGGPPVEPGYLLEERLPEQEAARIAAHLDLAIAVRPSARSSYRVAAGLVAATVAAAAIVGWLMMRPQHEATPPATPPALVEIAPPPSPPRESPASRPVPRASKRALTPAPAAPAPSASTPPRLAEPERHQHETNAPTPRSAAVAAKPPAPAVLDASIASLPAHGDERVMQLMAIRRDDPRRRGIFMRISYRRSPDDIPKEVSR